MKYDSPLARGNNFNKKAVQEAWYPYNEVHLGNGKRLDSYVKPDPELGIGGEIISRKAVDLDDVGLNNFESYLKELDAKYAPGTPINSPKYSPLLDDEVLQGQKYLELPNSNQGLNNLDEYIALADKYNVKLRFMPE